MEQQGSELGVTSERLSSVANSTRLLKSFGDNAHEIGISALAKRLGLAKSTVHRLASTLLDAGLLEQNLSTGRYRLGLVMFELGSQVRRRIDICSEAKPWMMRLRSQIGETIRLAILDRDRALYINVLTSPRAVQTTPNIGQSLPLRVTAEGMALLAFQPQDFIERTRNVSMILEQMAARV